MEERVKLPLYFEEASQSEQDVFVKHECPQNGHFFEKCNVYI